MTQNDKRNRVGRRPFLAAAAGSVGLLGANGAAPPIAEEAKPESPFLTGLASLPLLRDYDARRASSYDRSGGNDDNVPEARPGEVKKMVDVTGPGQITHIWLAVNTDDPLHLKRIVLRAYWDGETNPSIEAPIGDFFGLGLGEFFTYQSALTNVAPWRGLNCYFPMPFAESALLTLTNEGPIKADNYYFNVDYVSFTKPLEGAGYFHAQYRQEAPCHGWTDNWTSNGEPQVNNTKNLDGKGNYLFFEAQGRGHLLGVTQAVLQNQGGWYGEGDEMIFIDGSDVPLINGTGTEDYFNGSWDYKGPSGPAQAYSYLSIGTPFVENAEMVGDGTVRTVGIWKAQ